MELIRFFALLSNDEHRRSLLVDCPWHIFDFRLNFSDQVDDDVFQKQKKKKKRGGKDERIIKTNSQNKQISRLK